MGLYSIKLDLFVFPEVSSSHTGSHIVFLSIVLYKQLPGPKTSTQYVITGKADGVRSAATQFEKMLGLDAGSSTITYLAGTSSAKSKAGAGASKGAADGEDTTTAEANSDGDGGGGANDNTNEDGSGNNKLEEESGGGAPHQKKKVRRRNGRTRGPRSKSSKDTSQVSTQSSTPSGEGGSSVGI